MAAPAQSNGPVQGSTANITTTGATDLLAAPGAGKYNRISSIIVTNGSGSTSTWVKIVDETTGDILVRGFAAAGQGWTYYPPPMTGPIRQQTTNKKVQVICETSGAEVGVTATGYIQK